jgi:nucleoside-diphosphate-sugar epimerase
MRVTAVVRQPPRELLCGTDTLTGDLADADWASDTRKMWRWDDVVHLAGPVAGTSCGFEEESQVARAHVGIALSLSRAIPEGWSGRLIHASSMTVYGAALNLPVLEQQPLRPRFLYALGKMLAEDVWRSTGLSDYWLLRLPGLFSAERRSGALYHFVRAGLEGRPIRLTATEPTPWDILHVDDAAGAVVRSLGCAVPFQGAMNLSHGEVVKLERVAQRIAQLTTRQDVINEAGVEHPPFQLDIGIARERIGWEPCSLDQRLEELVRDVSVSRG